MKKCLSLFLFCTAIAFARADEAAAPDPKGIIVLNTVAGHNAATIVFTSITWTNTYGGVVTDGSGAKVEFTNDAIAKVIYSEKAYYDQIDHYLAWLNWRAGIQTRELILPPENPVQLGQTDLQPLQSNERALEDVGQRYPSVASYIAPRIAMLKDEIGKLSNGMALQDGKWIPQKASETVAVVPVVGDANRTITFTTKDGRKFEDARVTVTNTGLSVLTPEGGANIPFEQLPDNLSAFPPKIQDQIRINR